jgi:hypothetical protein
MTFFFLGVHCSLILILLSAALAYTFFNLSDIVVLLSITFFFLGVRGTSDFDLGKRSFGLHFFQHK